MEKFTAQRATPVTCMHYISLLRFEQGDERVQETGQVSVQQSGASAANLVYGVIFGWSLDRLDRLLAGHVRSGSKMDEADIIQSVQRLLHASSHLGPVQRPLRTLPSFENRYVPRIPKRSSLVRPARPCQVMECLRGRLLPRQWRLVATFTMNRGEIHPAQFRR